jgi:hypothetical protein
MDAGADAGPPPDAGPDGGADAGLPACDPVAQTGCKANQRCTLLLTGPGAGQFTCLADGTVPTGGSCSIPDAGGAPTYDDCVHGSICVGGTCDLLCTQTPDNCPTNFACQLYSGGADEPTYGACDATCNPLTQVRNTDGAVACGSPDSSNPTLGCYGPPIGPFFCAKSLDTSATSDVPAGTGGVVFGNSCAPGFMPLLHASTADQVTVICVAICEPGTTSSSQTANAAGKVGSPYTCPARGAGGTHECHFWWLLEDPTQGLDQYSNSIGYCLDYTQYQYDSNGDSIPDKPFPSCTTLSDTAHTFDATLSDNVFWGCGPYP